MTKYTVKFIENAEFRYLADIGDYNDTTKNEENAYHFSRDMAERKAKTLRQYGYQQVRISEAS